MAFARNVRKSKAEKTWFFSNKVEPVEAIPLERTSIDFWGPILAKWSDPEGAIFKCLRTQYEFLKIERIELRMGQKSIPGSERGIAST